MRKPLSAGERRLGAQTRAILHERHPDVFVGADEPKRPLRLGIHVDLMRAHPDLSPYKIRLALRDYVTGPRYARCMILGMRRIGIDGGLYEVVEERAAAHAAAYLAEFERQNAERAASAQGETV